MAPSEAYLKDLWSRTRVALGELPGWMVALLERVPALIAESERDADRRQRREVYLGLATLVARHTGGSLPLCLDAVHQVLGEREPELLEAGAPCSPALVEEARGHLVRVRVRYSKARAGRSQRTIEAYIVAGGNVRVVHLERMVDWDWLPAEVREGLLGEPGRQAMEFELL
ncbi:MAG TPA: hypothetical protein PK668_20960 [Myxococcota bacterium]|nr:hypothetical protein [Myxococcota bacterium]HRY96617.1 hypothetical protein [Myxococcota bacterium]HSA21412.1 hypothetical protein [Myxococcota bacterium]